MPVTRKRIYEKRAEPRYTELRDRLLAEWRRGTKKKAKSAPNIEEEVDARDRVVHVEVTWDDWADLDAQTRSEMIVDAFAELKGPEAVLDLSLAMGLTAAEAARIHGSTRR